MADAGRKQLEQVMHQLQEQLQINLLQQTHLMQAGEKAGPKSQAAMQQLQMQQQQLISQLQLVQQRILLVSQFFATLSTGGVRFDSNFTLVEKDLFDILKSTNYLMCCFLSLKLQCWQLSVSCGDTEGDRDPFSNNCCSVK